MAAPTAEADTAASRASAAARHFDEYGRGHDRRAGAAGLGLPAHLEGGQGGAGITFHVVAETGELATWLLMPRGKEYRSFRIIRYLTSKPAEAEKVRIVTEYLADDYTIIAFKLLALKPGYTYEVGWMYK